jgi:hypothetical protein
MVCRGHEFLAKAPQVVDRLTRSRRRTHYVELKDVLTHVASTRFEGLLL